MNQCLNLRFFTTAPSPQRCRVDVSVLRKTYQTLQRELQLQLVIIYCIMLIKGSQKTAIEAIRVRAVTL